MYFYGVQAEVGATRSSLIPTSGQQGTREAETFTIPSANLPWPEPRYTQTYIDDDFSSYADQTAMDSAGYNFFNTTFDAANDQVDFTATSANLTFTDAASPPKHTLSLIHI